MHFIDFNRLKERVTYEQAVDALRLSMRRHSYSWRGKCPACDSQSDRALVVTEGKGFYCFDAK
jgi:hypothetical protein